MAAILKNRYDILADAKYHVDNYTFVKIETGSSFISAVGWDILSKFGMQIDYGLPEQIPSLKLNLEVVFRLYGRHNVKSIWRHNSAADRPITMKFGWQMQNDMPMSMYRS